MELNDFKGMTKGQAFKKLSGQAKEARETLAEEGRKLKLMEAGLTMRPFDKDFYDLQKHKWDSAVRMQELGEMLLPKLKELSEGDSENDRPFGE